MRKFDQGTQKFSARCVLSRSGFVWINVFHTVIQSNRTILTRNFQKNTA